MGDIVERKEPNDKAKLAAKLLNVMSLISYVEKKGKNQFHHYNYQREVDIKNAVRTALVENKIFPLQSSKMKQIIQGEKGGYLTIIEYHVEFIDTETGHSLSIQFDSNGADKGDKGMFKAITGAIKYMFINNFIIASESGAAKTPDAEEDSPDIKAKVEGLSKSDSKKRVSDKMPLTSSIFNELRRTYKWKIDGISAEKVCEKYKWDDETCAQAIRSIADLPKEILEAYEKYPMAMDWIEDEYLNKCMGDVEKFRLSTEAHVTSEQSLPFNKEAGSA